MKRLRELKRRLELLMVEEPPEKRRQGIGEEIERYLLQRVLPPLSQSPLFYLDYYRTLIAPELETLEKVSSNLTPAQAGAEINHPEPPSDKTGFPRPRE